MSLLCNLPLSQTQCTALWRLSMNSERCFASQMTLQFLYIQRTDEM